MEGNELKQSSAETNEVINSFFESMYFKHYLISLCLWIAMLIINIFNDRRDAPDIGFWFGMATILFVPPFTALGSFIGQKFRDFTKPDFIMTSGATETFKAKIFWMFGPQVIGWFIALMIIGNIVG